MCLIMSIAAAIAFWRISVFQNRRGGNFRNARTACLMFLGASLMWSVDGISAFLGGESFLDLSGEDFLLGLIVVGAGSAYYKISQRKKGASR